MIDGFSVYNYIIQILSSTNSSISFTCYDLWRRTLRTAYLIQKSYYFCNFLIGHFWILRFIRCDMDDLLCAGCATKVICEIRQGSCSPVGQRSFRKPQPGYRFPGSQVRIPRAYLLVLVVDVPYSDTFKSIAARDFPRPFCIRVITIRQLPIVHYIS